MADWHALQVRASRELEIAAELPAETIVPVTYVSRRVSRRDPRRVWARRAKFAGYVVAKIHDWPSTLAADGVFKAVGAHGTPERISPRTALEMAEMSDPEPEEDPDARPVIKRGMQVRILSDTWAGRAGTVRDVRKRTVLVGIGRWTVEVADTMVEVVGNHRNF